MSMRRRALLMVLVCAPLLWVLALGVSLYSSALRIDVLYDTEQVRLARVIAAVLPQAVSPARQDVARQDDGAVVALAPGSEGLAADGAARATRVLTRHLPGQRGPELAHLALAVWNRDGQKRIDHQDGVALPFQPAAQGFQELVIAGQRWRVFYHDVPEADALVVVGQDLRSRARLQRELLVGQFLPWLAMLLALLLVLSIGLRRAFEPVAALTDEIEARRSGPPGGAFRPLRDARLPQELAPLALAINRLIARTGDTIAADRRFAADTARQLGAAFTTIQSYWDAITRTTDPGRRRDAAVALGRELDQTHALVSRLDLLARLDEVDESTFRQRVDWSAVVVEALAHLHGPAAARRLELAVDWRVPAAQVMPIFGNGQLLAVALRCLAENAIRHAPPGSTIRVLCEPDRIAVEDDGRGVLPNQLVRLGERYFRGPDPATAGPGLGLAIVRRVADLHALRAEFGNRTGGGFRAELARH